MAQDHLRVELRSAPDRVVVRLSGELDLASGALLEREIERAEVSDAASIVLDLDALEFIDSTGLRIILTASERAREREQEFAITRGSLQVQRLLAITRVDERLNIIVSPDQSAR